METGYLYVNKLINFELKYFKWNKLHLATLVSLLGIYFRKLDQYSSYNRSYSSNNRYKQSSRENSRSHNFDYNNHNENSTTTAIGKRDFLQFNNAASAEKNSDRELEQFEDLQKKVKTDTRDRSDWQNENNNRSRTITPIVMAQDEEKLAPWMSQSTQKIKNTLVRFHNEIIDFVNFCVPSKEEHAKRERSIEK